MIALLDQEGGSVRPLLAKAGANMNLLRSKLGEVLDHLPQVHGTEGELHVSNDLGKLLNQTDKLAQKRQDQYISSEFRAGRVRRSRHPLARRCRSGRRAARWRKPW
jgi:ATP-dependent Clp protease ATP-binding subunit ClpB